MSDSWQQYARDAKQRWLRRRVSPDMPPMVIACRDGETLASATAPKVDRDLGLDAAYFLRRGFDPDTIVFLSDGYARRDGPGPLAPGELQRLWEAGDRRIVSEALLCAVAHRDGRVDFHALPYTLVEMLSIRWHEPHFSDAPRGDLPRFLRQIMDTPTLHEHPLIRESAAGFGFDADRARFHHGRAVLAVLRERGYLVEDLISARHPEWISDRSEASPALKPRRRRGR